MCADTGQVVVSAKRICEFGVDGRAKWKKEVGYHRRSRVEAFMHRYKTIVGEKLMSRRSATQTTEAMIKLHVLNQMMELGMPKSYRVIA